MPLDFTAFAYATMVAAGGVTGYVRSNSVISLAAGLIFGSALGVGAYQVSQDPTNIGIFLGTSVVLGGMMGYRFYNSGKIMPPGLIALVSTLMVIRTIARYSSHSSLKTT